ncbi:ATPase, AFG1 family [Moritella viscosa]|uniref:Cell division protein ZapE n=2 Tax=Moritella viscosa TaxID=80854 RepID=A0ABY1HEA8_9GAMM|nr:AFG1-like ATPase [Moritella viscosa]SGY92217.1 ATPase, AFG1 family [Moritella viscosa]SGY97067.1 ATPase, AFG1 family [Moritella viscosa]SGZ02785.1 ATPase, AFG1 family [Moritella viscosa]SHO26424.1 ATPase, AFG1 family [Moritella viscosa]
MRGEQGVRNSKGLVIIMTPIKKYQLDLKRPDFMFDAAQENAVIALQRLFDELLVVPDKPVKRSFLAKFKGLKAKPTPTLMNPVKGIYFWGGVGRGKTYLVDTFYDCLPFENKTRIHFHRFMHRIHQELKGLAQQKDPLKVIAKKLANETRVICFDEFFVSDITDAMILGTLFEELFSHQVILVATSNIIPDELYRNGLQRARFLPAIHLINQNCDIINVDSGVDYRLRTLEQAEIYHFPLDGVAQKNLDQYFQQLSCDPRQYNQSIEIENRQIPTLAEADSVLMIDFAELCGGPRSQVDYMEISRIYHTVLLANVKQMGRLRDDIARRFIAMVDEFYERNVTLIISAEFEMSALYSTGLLDFEFRRCLSRLQEMQSHEYLAREHLP